MSEFVRAIGQSGPKCLRYFHTSPVSYGDSANSGLH